MMMAREYSFHTAEVHNETNVTLHKDVFASVEIHHVWINGPKLDV